MLPRLKPRCFYDLVIEVAIVRPGPIQGDMVHPYLRRRDGLSRSNTPREALGAVLPKTCGVPLFQEQAMQIAIVGAGFSPGEADRLRRAMATFRNVGTIHTFREKFISGMIGNGYSRGIRRALLQPDRGLRRIRLPREPRRELRPAGLCLRLDQEALSGRVLRRAPQQPAHGLLCARRSWCAMRASTASKCGTRRQSQRLGLHARAGQPSRCAVRLGLRLVSGAPEKITQQIVAARGSGYADLPSVWMRSGVPVSVVERLADADAFRSIGLDRRAALWAVRGLDGGALQAGAKRATAAKNPLMTPPGWAISSMSRRSPCRR